MSLANLQIKKGKGDSMPPFSAYKPSKEAKKMLNLVRADFTDGYSTMNQPFVEFNNMSLIQRMRRDQQTFNTYSPQDGLNAPGLDSWKSNAMRPIARNKVISTIAHVTQKVIYPRVSAQNENDELDQDAATVMRLAMQWAGEQSDYEKTQLYSAISAAVNPAAITHTEYTEVYEEVPIINDDGEREVIKCLNEDYSGFKDTIVPCDEIFIENIYEHDIQKQGFLVWRRVISYTSAYKKYGYKYDNFKFVQPGLQVFYYPATDSFYEQYDEDLADNLVEEIIYWNKSLNTRQILINGVLMTEPDAVNPRKDRKYPFTKSGYELIDEGKFFYYKSLIFKMQPDVRIINQLYEMVIDGTYLNIFPPMVITGDDEITSDIIAPGAATVLNENSNIQPIFPGTNVSAGLNATQLVENSITESSTPPQFGGDTAPGDQTKFEVQLLQQNASTVLSSFAKQIAFAVKDYGNLRKNDILQYLTVGEVMNLGGEGSAIKFKNLLLEDQDIEGRLGSIKIEFMDGSMPDEMTEKFRKEQEMALAEREGLDNDTRIYRVNPRLWREMKYKIKITPDLITPPSQQFESAMALAEYDRAIQNPYVNQEKITRDLLLGAFPRTAEDPDSYMKKAEPATFAEVNQGGGVGSPKLKEEVIA